MQHARVRVWPVPAGTDMVAVEKVVQTDSIDIAEGDDFNFPELRKSLPVITRIDEDLQDAEFELRFETTREDVKYLEECGWKRVGPPCTNCPPKKRRKKK